MTKAKSSRGKRVAAPAPTILRAYRFNADVMAAFENDCARHLRNPRLVLQALIHHWLEADSKAQMAIADRFQRHLAESNRQ
jgi:hypothetical protein